MALSATACQTAETLPDVRICKEIPFLDAPEGACVWTVSHKTELIDPREWATLRPYMLMLDDHGWTDIKVQWTQACQMAAPGNCNVTVNSVDNLIQNLDAIVGSILGYDK